ncbi:MAG TPA: hypothetical protein VJR89_13825 [Polyangiales bacterium]|nr:hypothetical protein [Polyangiales bacterium]
MSDAKRPRSTKPRARKISKPPPDFAIVGGPTEDGQGAHLLRFREGSVTAGEIRPVREGEPITHKELVRLHPLDEERRICRVETLHEPPPEPQSSGPARVSNERYRKNWDRIFDSEGTRKKDWDVN